MAALMPVLLVFTGLITCAVLWCLLSSCLGTSMRDSVASLWEHLVLSASSGDDRTLQARRRAAQGRFSEIEEWEMEYRGSRTY
ncbi:hypothetical protein B0H10DRAFT_479791 [Mycena sp. CBHHK59/15]|nr:hypothetical protein B0H10DRAFT_479791 [Mycena sp. CBHHK59/15]